MSDRTPEQRAADRREIEKLHPGERFQMMLDTPTPETDAEALSFECDGVKHFARFILTDFARQLERERNEARENASALGRLAAKEAEKADEMIGYLEETERERDQLRARVAELEGELKEVTEKRNAVLQRLLEKTK